MPYLTLQRHCSACAATRAQWANANQDFSIKTIEFIHIVPQTESFQSTPDTLPEPNISTPGKPYPIPPTSGEDSHPYAKQAGGTDFDTSSELDVPQTKVWRQPKYHVVVGNHVDIDDVKQLVASIRPPGLTQSVTPRPKPNVSQPLDAPP